MTSETQSKHTPGPWSAIECQPRYGGSEVVFEVRAGVTDEYAGESVTGWGRVNQTKANANLIAAAPDLLEACKTLLEARLTPESDEMLVLEAVRMKMVQAIEKAEGVSCDD